MRRDFRVVVGCGLWRKKGGGGSTAFAAHANQAAWGRYGGIAWRVEVDGLPERIFPVVIRAMQPLIFVVGGVGRHLNKARPINKLLRLLETVKLAYAVDTASPFALRPWASGYRAIGNLYGSLPDVVTVAG